MTLSENFDLKNFNTFGIAVSAKYYTKFNSVGQLTEVLQNPSINHLPRLILGGGSNILFTKNFEGVVLHNYIKGIAISKEDETSVWVKAGAGEVWHDLVLYSIANNWGGIENLSLIPGTVGASPMQNIGAYGVEIKDVFDSLNAYHIDKKEVHTFYAQDCEFGYRESVFKKALKGKYIILDVTFKLSKHPQFNITYGAIQETLDTMGITELSVKAISDAVCAIRRSKLPNPAEIGNAGSFFKNPEITEEQFLALKTNYPTIPSYHTVPGKVKVPAGWLNEQCGWKGKTLGQYGVHKNQALVLVNYGNATGEAIRQLSEDIKKSVLDTFGIVLETEVNIY